MKGAAPWIVRRLVAGVGVCFALRFPRNMRMKRMTCKDISLHLFEWYQGTDMLENGKGTCVKIYITLSGALPVGPIRYPLTLSRW